MNHYLRLLWILFTATRRGSCDLLGPCRTPFRVGPLDLDLLGHMNNGIYLSIMDLGRVDLMARSGILRRLNARGWYPVVVAETIQFRKSLQLFERFEIETRVIGWDEKAFFVAQRFERRGEMVASALIRARFLRRGGSLAPAEILALAERPIQAPALPASVQRWSEEQAALREI